MEQNDLSMQSLKARYAREMAFWVVVVLISIAWWWFAVTPVPVAPPLMEIRGESTHADALCPGDTLAYTVNFHVTAPGVYAIDVATWRADPPATVLFSDARRIVLTEAIDYALTREWVIPPTYPDPTTSAPVPWLPGRYERRHAISTVSRATIPSIAIIKFDIAEGCES